MTPRAALALVALVTVAPIAAATLPVPVSTSGYDEDAYDRPEEETYSFLLSPLVFNATEPVFRAGVEVAADFGRVGYLQEVRWQTSWIVSNATQTVNVTVEGGGGRTILSANVRWLRVYVDGLATWAWQGDAGWTVPLLGDFDYRDSHFIGYAENVSFRVPLLRQADGTIHSGGAVAHDWANAARGYADTGGLPTVVIGDAVAGVFHANVPSQTGLYWTEPNDIEAALFPSNDTVGHKRYWLSNLTDPTDWSVTTRYTVRPPEVLSLRRVFETEPTFALSVQAAASRFAGCLFPTLARALDFCPSVSGLIAWTVSVIPSLLGVVVGFVHERAGEGITKAGDFAGQFVALPFFALEVAIQRPVKLTLLIGMTISGHANLIGALRGGDFGSIVEWHIRGFKAFGRALAAYFVLIWRAGRWVAGKLVDAVAAIGGWIPFT